MRAADTTFAFSALLVDARLAPSEREGLGNASAASPSSTGMLLTTAAASYAWASDCGSLPLNILIVVLALYRSSTFAPATLALLSIGVTSTKWLYPFCRVTSAHLLSR